MEQEIKETKEKISAKDYNKQYYAKNKDEIKAKLFTKEVCSNCSKLISHQNMKQHQSRGVCRSKVYKNDILEMKKEIDILKALVITFSKNEKNEQE